MQFLSKNGNDEYINMLAAGCNAPVLTYDTFDYHSSTDPLVIRGILKYKLIKQCWADNRTFYYVDSGYFGNQISRYNPGGCKWYHRIVKNNLQHDDIIDRPGDRFDKLDIKILPWKKTGGPILIAAPDEKPCKFYGFDKNEWVAETISTISQYTDRPIIVRDRAKDRLSRIATDPFSSAISNVFAVVTFNSVAATESIMQGIPAFVLAPSNAASPVALRELSKIETPYYPPNRKEWANHLAYCQFHISEMKNGTAMRELHES